MTCVLSRSSTATSHGTGSLAADCFSAPASKSASIPPSTILTFSYPAALSSHAILASSPQPLRVCPSVIICLFLSRPKAPSLAERSSGSGIFPQVSSPALPYSSEQVHISCHVVATAPFIVPLSASPVQSTKMTSSLPISATASSAEMIRSPVKAAGCSSPADCCTSGFSSAAGLFFPPHAHIIDNMSRHRIIARSLFLSIPNLLSIFYKRYIYDSLYWFLLQINIIYTSKHIHSSPISLSTDILPPIEVWF